MHDGENCPPQILLSKNREGPAVTCMNKYIGTCHRSILKKKEFMRLLSSSRLLPHACGASGLARHFPRWPFTVTSFPVLCWQQAPITCMSSFRAAPALSSFVRMKVSSQSCTTCFDNAGLLSWLCSISTQSNEDWYYI